MDLFLKNCSIPIQKINSELINSKKVELYILRLDTTDEFISGNKYFKLKYNIKQAQEEQKNKLLTFGGAFSNHIAATAAAGKLCNINTIGIIRGEEHLPLNHTIFNAIQNGMEIHYMDRTTYRQKHSTQVTENLINQFGDFYLIPEGGTNDLAIQGTKEISSFIPIDINFIACAVGTGGTMAGIIQSTSAHVIAFPALKGDFIEQMINELLPKPFPNWEIQNNYHFGGYAKTTPELLHFITQFEKKYAIPIEQIYTGKMMFGIFDLIKKDYFPTNSKIMAIHSGGLQGKIN